MAGGRGGGRQSLRRSLRRSLRQSLRQSLRRRGAGGAGLLGELVEEGVLAVVGGPDGKVAGPGDAGLGGLPEELGVWMLGEFVEANVAAVNGHRSEERRVGKEC